MNFIPMDGTFTITIKPTSVYDSYVVTFYENGNIVECVTDNRPLYTIVSDAQKTFNIEKLIIVERDSIKNPNKLITDEQYIVMDCDNNEHVLTFRTYDKENNELYFVNSDNTFHIIYPSDFMYAYQV